MIQKKCKSFELLRDKYSECQLGYRIQCKRDDYIEQKIDFLERPSIIISNCNEKFPKQLLYVSFCRNV